jgi:hypothetical protein
MGYFVADCVTAVTGYVTAFCNSNQLHQSVQPSVGNDCLDIEFREIVAAISVRI